MKEPRLLHRSTFGIGPRILRAPVVVAPRRRPEPLVVVCVAALCDLAYEILEWWDSRRHIFLERS